MNVVIDLETLALSPNACILSIGACSENGEKFYTELDWEAQRDLWAREVNQSTWDWWMAQEAENPGLFPGGAGCQLLVNALQELSEWLSAYDKEELKIWCRGLNFDISILEHAFRQQGVEIPWKYNMVRDVRTALDVVPGLPGVELQKPRKKHHALKDAIADMKNLADRDIVKDPRVGEL